MNHLKIVNASQGIVRQYENVKRKLFECNANIYFNRQCHQMGLIPNFAKIKIPISSPAAKSTQRKTQNLRIKDEIKYLYMKKTTIEPQIILLSASILSQHMGQ